MLIKYNKENILSFPVGNEPSGTLKIQPGMNEFPSDVFKAVEKHPIVSFLVESGVIEFPTFKAEKKEKGKEKIIGKKDEEIDLSELSVKDANTLVRETFNLEMLDRWDVAETRIKVKKVIEKQLEDIHNPKVVKK